MGRHPAVPAHRARGVRRADDPAGVIAQRPGALERAELVLADWRDTRRRLAEVETRMVAVLDELELTELVSSIDGLTAVGAAAILAETGDLTRFAARGRWSSTPGCARGTTPAAQHQGKTSISGKGRPGLRLAAWRAVWARPAEQPGARRPVPVSDHPRAQPAGPPASPRGLRGGAAALAARRGHRRVRLGPRHRRPARSRRSDHAA